MKLQCTLLACLLLCITQSGWSQTLPGSTGTTNYVLLVVPEEDTVTTGSAAYRLSASTLPGSAVAVNGVSYKVYPSGAFCGLLNLSVGENRFTITSTHASAGIASKSFLVIRSKPIQTTSKDTVLIEDALMLPAQSLWLREGDLLEVQCKGTPGCRATFLNGIPMAERPITQTGGIGGIYRGTYAVRASDSLVDQPVTFRLQDSTGHVVTKETTAKVSFMQQALPLVGVTKGQRPFLNTGTGEDRLGGFKLAFIDTGIRLKITGKAGSLYRVALTDNQEAWIEERFVDLQPAGTFFPSSLTGNMTVMPESSTDVVRLALNDRLPYASYQLLEPSRIVVDVFGATANTNWITQQPSAKEIANVYYVQAGKGVFRVTIELKHRQIWGYAIGYEGTTLRITVRHQPRRLRLKSLTFGLDAGHGGDNRGAVGSTGVLEKDINLAIVQLLKRRLEDDGARVILTRSDDTNVSMVDRFMKVYRGGADILISIHSNSIGLTSNPEDSKGTGTFYKYICYRPLSQFILHSVLKTGLDTLGNVGSFNFALNGPTELPNVLVETAYLSNPEDEMKLLDDDFRGRLAERIVDGVEDFLDYCDE